MSDYSDYNLWDGQPRQYCRELPIPDPHATGVWVRPAPPAPPRPPRPLALRALILLATAVVGVVGVVGGILLLWLMAIFAFSL